MTEFLTMQTNELIITFVLNNIILLEIIRRITKWVCKKTPWAWDDDLSSLIGGLIKMIKDRKKVKSDE